MACYIPPGSPENDTPAPPSDKPTRAQGPLLIAREPMALPALKGKTIAVPGTRTSAFLGLQMAIGSFDYKVIMFDQIPHAVQNGDVEAGLIIHEGQLTYGQLGLHCLLDLGQWWFGKTQLPMPLGCNIIRRDLGDETMRQISEILKSSIEYSLSNRDQAVTYALQFGRDLNHDQASEFVGMYVNDWTLDYGPVGRRAVREFLAQGYQAGLVPEIDRFDFV